MTLKQVPGVLKPAKPLSVKAHHVPRLPEWYPMDPGPDDDGNPRPKLTDQERLSARRARQVLDAISGPFDGQHVVVTFDPRQGPPRRFIPVSSPHVWYELDERESDKHQLVYRYCMDSPVHHRAILAVEEAFAEVGRDYIVAAREETDHERTAPKL